MSRIVTCILFVLVTALYHRSVLALPDLSRYHSTAEKITALTNICDSLYRADDNEALRQTALDALDLVPAGDAFNRSQFLLFIGKSYASVLPVDTAILYLEQALEQARISKQSGQVSEVLMQLLYSYYSEGNEAKRDRTAAELERLLPEVKEDRKRSDMMAVIGNYYNNLGVYDKTLHYLLASLELSKRLDRQGKIKERENIGVDLLNVGEVFMQMEQDEKALEYVREARQYMVYGKSRIPYYYRDMVLPLMALGQPQLAAVYYDSLLTMEGIAGNSPDKWACVISADISFAGHYLHAGKPAEALKYTDHANQLAIDWADPYLKASVDYKTGEVYTALGRYTDAIQLLKAAEPVVRESRKEYAALLQAMGRSYAGTGRWQDAYVYNERFAQLQDSLHTIAAKRGLAEAEARYKNKEKQQQIEVQQARIRYAGRQRIWLIAGLCLTGLVTVLLTLIYRNKKRSADMLARLNQDLETANSTKLRLFAIISHDLRAPISQVHQYLKLQQLKPGLLDADKKQELNDKIRVATGSLLETMEDLLLWSKTQLSSFTASCEQVGLYEITRQQLELLALSMEDKKLQLQDKIPVSLTVYSDPNFLQTILRNLLQNAVKAAPGGSQLCLEASASAGNCVLRISNTGAAFRQEDFEQLTAEDNPAPELSGMGLRLVAELARRIKARIHFEQEHDRTIAVVTLPLTS